MHYTVATRPGDGHASFEGFVSPVSLRDAHREDDDAPGAPGGVVCPASMWCPRYPVTGGS